MKYEELLSLELMLYCQLKMCQINVFSHVCTLVITILIIIIVPVPELFYLGFNLYETMLLLLFHKSVVYWRILLLIETCFLYKF